MSQTDHPSLRQRVGSATGYSDLRQLADRLDALEVAYAEEAELTARLTEHVAGVERRLAEAFPPAHPEAEG